MTDLGALLSALNEGRHSGQNPPDSTPIAVFADFLQEHQMPGENIARSAAYHVLHGDETGDHTIWFGRNPFTGGMSDDRVREDRLPGEYTPHIYVNPYIDYGHQYYPPEESHELVDRNGMIIGHHRQGHIADMTSYVLFTRPHDAADPEDPQHLPKPVLAYTWRLGSSRERPLRLFTPIHSKAHLEHLTSDLPEEERNAIYTQVVNNHNVPDTHESDTHTIPTRFSRLPSRRALMKNPRRYASPYQVSALQTRGFLPNQSIARKGLTDRSQLIPQNALHGTRLSIILHEIMSRFGKHDPELADLATQALRGRDVVNGQDVFTAIRDKLLSHTEGARHDQVAEAISSNYKNQDNARAAVEAHVSRANELAHAYNWHRVSDGLRIDNLVRDFLLGSGGKKGVAKDSLRRSGRVMRATHNVFGSGLLGGKGAEVNPENYTKFWNMLIDHVKNGGPFRERGPRVGVFRETDPGTYPVKSPMGKPLSPGRPRELQYEEAENLSNPEKVGNVFSSRNWGELGIHGGTEEEKRAQLKAIIEKSIYRLAQNEQHLEATAARSDTTGKSPKVGTVDPASPAWTSVRPGLRGFPTTKGKVKTLPGTRPSQFRRLGIPTRYAMAVWKDERPPNAIRNIPGEAQPAYLDNRGGTYKDENGVHVPKSPWKAGIENIAIQKTLMGLGLVPPQRDGETQENYESRIAKHIGLWKDLMREYVHAYPNDVLSRHYIKGMDSISPSVSDVLTHAIYHAAPVAKYIASLRGRLPELQHLWAPRPDPTAKLPEETLDHSGEETLRPRSAPSPEEPIDLLDPIAHEDIDSAAVGVMGDTSSDERSKARLGSFGEFKDLHVIPKEYGTVDDYSLPGDLESGKMMEEVGKSAGLDPKSDPVIKSIERYRPYVPVKKVPKDQLQQVRQAIADHERSGRSREQPTPAMLMEKFGFDQKTADRMHENYKKLKQKPLSEERPPSNKLPPKPAMTPRRQRKFQAYRAGAGGIAVVDPHTGVGNFYTGGEMTPDMKGDYVSGDEKTKRTARLAKARAKWKSMRSL